MLHDWGVIADYCHRFDSLPIKAHAMKVLSVDLFLLIAVPAALYPAQLGITWGAVSLLMFVTGLIVMMFFWRARHFGGRDA